jgi:hypothetical protein
LDSVGEFAVKRVEGHARQKKERMLGLCSRKEQDVFKTQLKVRAAEHTEEGVWSKTGQHVRGQAWDIKS